MIIESIWVTKLVLAHLITDFILQPKSWVKDRNEKHFTSAKLYLHGFVTGAFAWILIGWQYWPIALIIWVTHTLIDGWKSYQKNTVTFFLIDQAMHLLIIIGCWYVTFIHWDDVQAAFHQLDAQPSLWKTLVAFVFLTTPAGILIGQVTKKWRDKIENAESLANAGAKGIIRFNEKDRLEIKTEYLVIGTLMSIGLAIVTGMAIKL